MLLFVGFDKCYNADLLESIINQFKAKELVLPYTHGQIGRTGVVYNKHNFRPEQPLCVTSLHQKVWDPNQIDIWRAKFTKLKAGTIPALWYHSQSVAIFAVEEGYICSPTEILL